VYDSIIRLRLGNGMNLFIYYTSNLWHSLRGMQDRFRDKQRKFCMQIFNVNSKEGKEIINDGQVVLAMHSCTKDRGGVQLVHVKWSPNAGLVHLRFSHGHDLAKQLHGGFCVS
jgi:hypothetical protein